MRWVSKSTCIEWIVNGKFQWWELTFFYKSQTIKVDNLHAIEEVWCPRNWIVA